jgi:hypothetical protein
MFSELAFTIIVYLALTWTGLAFLSLVVLLIKDWKNKRIW